MFGAVPASPAKGLSRGARIEEAEVVETPAREVHRCLLAGRLQVRDEGNDARGEEPRGITNEVRLRDHFVRPVGSGFPATQASQTNDEQYAFKHGSPSLAESVSLSSL